MTELEKKIRELEEEQLDRIETMLLNHGRLLVALANLAERALPMASLSNPGGLRSKDLDELRRAIADVAPWRKR